MNARATPAQLEAYRAAAVADELAIAKLLGWGNLPPLESALETNHNLATWGRYGGFKPLPNRQVLPRWRRDWSGAGELIGRCKLSIAQVGATALVSAPDVETAIVEFTDHPTKDDAIRFAMCQVAIAALTAERAPP